MCLCVVSADRCYWCAFSDGCHPTRLQTLHSLQTHRGRSLPVSLFFKPIDEMPFSVFKELCYLKCSLFDMFYIIILYNSDFIMILKWYHMYNFCVCVCFCQAGRSYRASHFIQPKLSQSQLSFKDLHMDPDTGKVPNWKAHTSYIY